MSEALEDLEFIKEKFAYLEYSSETFNVPKKELCNIEEALNRLESIDNANISKALEGVDILYANAVDLSKENECIKYLPEYLKPIKDNIKQALLKTQEPKHYLKWEDLEFKNYEQEISVLLNDNKYSLKYMLLPDDDYYMLWIYKENKCIFSLDGHYSENKQFFNDLHLEVIDNE